MNQPCPVTDLFQNRRFRGRLLDRIQDVTLAKTAGGRVYLNVRFNGQHPPFSWLESLACAVRLPDVPYVGRIDRVIPSEDDLTILRCTRCAAFDSTDGYLPAGTVVTLSDPESGDRRNYDVQMD